MVTGDVKRRNTTVNHRLKRPKTSKRHLPKKLLKLLATATTSTHKFLSKNDLTLLPSQTLTLEHLLLSLSTSLSLSSPSLSPPPPCWFNRFLATATADYDSRWLFNFRMSRSSFSLLLRILAPSLSDMIPSISPINVLAAGLFRLAHAASYGSVAIRFGIDASTACRAFFVVCKIVNEKLGHLFELRDDIARIVVGFGWISLPNCCGVLGLERFRVGDEVLGQNGALMVQALVDSEGRFLDVSAGWPSTLRPGAILRQTKLFSAIEESKEVLNGPAYELDYGDLIIPQYILGASCFPLLPWLLTPYCIRSSEEEDSFNPSLTAFNSVHDCAMGLVRTAFGRVRARWQLLSKQWSEDRIEDLPFVVVTGCLLHNFLIKGSEPFPEGNVGSPEEEHEVPVFEGEADENGRSLRNAIASHLTRVSMR